MMLERFIGEQMARSTEAGLILTSLYDEVVSAYSSLSKAERIVGIFSPILSDRFTGELRELLRDFGSAALQLAKVNWKSWDEVRSFRETGALDSYREVFRGIEQRANALRERIIEELTISTSVLAAAIERSEGNDLVLRFIAARVREIPLKADQVAPNYLEIVMGILSEYISSGEEDVLAVVREVGDIRRGIAELEKSGIVMEELEGLSRLLDYAKQHARRFRFLVPGLLRYLKEIREEVLPRPRARGEG